MIIKLKQVRKEKKISQEQLSNKTGVSRSYISEIESGKYTPTIDVICKFCRALKCSTDELIDCDDSFKN